MTTEYVHHCDVCDAVIDFSRPPGELRIMDRDGAPLQFCSGRCIARFFDTGQTPARHRRHRDAPVEYGLSTRVVDGGTNLEQPWGPDVTRP